MPTEADTCRTSVVPALYRSGWTDNQIDEQRTFTDGRILVSNGSARRSKPKRADYLLYYQPSYPLAVGGAITSNAAGGKPADARRIAKDPAPSTSL